jgi:DNA topoisomerase-1
MKNLLIAEKADAAKKISYFLSNGNAKRTGGKVGYFTFTRDGDEYYVMGLSGHIMNLDYVESSWNISKLKELINTKPDLKIEKRAIAIAGTMKQLAKKVDRIIICTDYDREGELIGVEALNLLDVKEVKRARFSAFTKEEIENAFKNLEEVDYNLADSAMTRREVDLAWGAVLTRFMSVSITLAFPCCIFTWLNTYII